MTRGDLKIAVSTNGASPAMARRIRQQLEAEFGPAYARFLEFLADMRQESRRRFPDDETKRRAFLETIVDSPALEYLKQNRLEQFESLIRQWTS
jgi:precorrin-2 dehydrogenase/sirohydrochlorin ferrochelatase